MKQWIPLTNWANQLPLDVIFEIMYLRLFCLFLKKAKLKFPFVFKINTNISYSNIPYVWIKSSLLTNFHYFSIEEYEISFLDKNKIETYELNCPNNRKKLTVVEKLRKMLGK